MTGARAFAAAQTIPIPGDIPANVEQHVRLVRAAATRDVTVLVFPELSLTGYALERARDLAFSDDDTRLHPLLVLARSQGMTLIVGAPVRSIDRPHIGAFILAPDGTVDLYTKRYLGESEDKQVSPGNQDPLVKLAGETGALAVCADANHPAHPQAAADRGATTYLVSSFISPSQFDERTAMLRSYAVRHTMTVVFANYGGPSGEDVSAGGSAIWSSDGEVVTQLDGPGLGLAVAREDRTGWQGEALELGRE